MEDFMNMSPTSAIVKFTYEGIEEGEFAKGSITIHITNIDTEGDDPIGTITYAEEGGTPLTVYLVAGDPVE